MASPVVLQDRWDLGFKRDLSRNQLPKGSAYDYVNVLPDLGRPLRKRGGWTAYGSALTSLNVTAGYPLNVVFAPFSAGAQVVAMDSSQYHVFDLTNSADRGVAQVPAEAPIFYRDKLIIGSAYNIGATPLKYTGSGAPGALGGSPPASSTFAVYKDRLAAGVWQGSVTPNRIYFSNAGNPESWDTTNAYFDTSATIYGLAPLPNGLLIFHSGTVEILRGNAPPSATGIGDMSLSPLFNDVGIFGANAYTVMGDKVVWADQYGIYTTDGAAFTDLTKEAQITDYWRSQVTAATPTEGVRGSSCAVGHWRDWAFISLLDGSGLYVDFLACNVKRRTFYRFDGIRAKNFSSRSDVTSALYFSNQSLKQVGNMVSTFEPDDTNSSDPDGWPINPVVETAYFDLGSKGKKRAGTVYVGYELDGTNQTVDVSYTTTPESTSYTAVTGTLPMSADYTRRRVRVGKAVNGFALKVESGFCDDFALYSLETETHPQEGSRV